MKEKINPFTIPPVTLREWQLHRKKQEQIIFERAYDRWDAEVNSWDDYILFLKILPRLLLSEIGIGFEPTTDSEAVVWSMILINYSYHAEWMNFLSPGDKPKPEGLNSELGNIFKSSAELSKAMLDLCIELYDRIPELQQFGSPAEIWFMWECLNCKRAIKQSRLIQGFYKQSPAKDTYLSEASALANWMERISEFSTVEEVFPKGIPQQGNIETFIMTVAAELAITAWMPKDRGFRKAFTALQKQIRKHSRFVRATEGVGGYELQNDQIVETGRSGKRKPKIVGQEFIPSVGYIKKSLHKKG